MGCGVAVGAGVGVFGKVTGVGVFGKVTGVGVFGKVTGVGVFGKVTGVGVFGKVTGVAVAMMGAGVTVGTSAMAVATRASTICWTSASDGPVAAQPAVPAEITIRPTIQKTRINCMQTLGILVIRLII